jgi:ABC-2 type transport system permease protein
VIGVEVGRQARRRRTYAALLTLVAIPIVVVVALVVNGGPAGDPQQRELVDVASHSGLNFTLFMLIATSQFLLVVIVALFAGDTVSSEGQWGSLRYLLTRPIQRAALLRTKLVVAVLYGLGAVLAVVGVSLALGTLAFGWHGVQTPLGEGLTPGTGLLRLALATGYVVAGYGVVVAFAFWFSTLTDQPLSAVGAAVVVIVLSEVLDQVTALGVVRYGLPTHYWGAWLNLLTDPVDTAEMARGLLVQVPYTVIPLVLAFRHFARKDVLS